jgi:alanine racemase
MTASLHIDLSIVAANIAAVRERVAPAEMMFVVKDDAYAHGLAPLVRCAWDAGVRWIGAFDVQTGSRVRATLGDDARVFVWIAASASDIAGAITDRLDVGIGSLELLDDVAVAARSAGERVRVHLKIDSGLHRNGVRPDQWPRFVSRARRWEAAGAVDVVGVWSHIAEASDDEDDAAREVFDWAVEEAHAAGLTPTLLHLAASAAAFARAEFRYDMVRVGAFCYGIRSAGGPHEKTLGLTLASRLDASVITIDDTSAIVGIGSLHGVPSTLAGRAEVGTPGGARILRRVHAATSEVDLWPGARIGDRVAIYGQGQVGEGSPTDLAEIIDTIGEEIALRVSPLVKRTYSQN